MQPNAYFFRKPSYYRAALDCIKLALDSASPLIPPVIAKAEALSKQAVFRLMQDPQPDAARRRGIRSGHCRGAMPINLSGLKFGVMRLADGIRRRLFLDDRESYLSRGSDALAAVGSAAAGYVKAPRMARQALVALFDRGQADHGRHSVVPHALVHLALFLEDPHILETGKRLLQHLPGV